MTGLRPMGRRGRSLAAALALAAGTACGRGQVPAAEYDPDAPVKETPAPDVPATAPAPSAAPGAAPAVAPLSPEQDSIQEAQAFARRQQSMETYESCVAKVKGIEEPIHTTLMEACARSRHQNAKP